MGLQSYLQVGAWPPDAFFAPAGGFDFTYVPPQPYYRPAGTAAASDRAGAAGTAAGMSGGTPIYMPLALK